MHQLWNEHRLVVGLKWNLLGSVTTACETRLLSYQKEFFKLSYLIFVVRFKHHLNSHQTIPQDTKPYTLKNHINWWGSEDIEIFGVVWEVHNISINEHLLLLAELNGGLVYRDFQVIYTAYWSFAAAVCDLCHNAECPAFNFLQDIKSLNTMK